jgi:hypothetical protein
MCLILLTVILELNFFIGKKNDIVHIIVLSIVGFWGCSCYFEAVFPGMLYIVLAYGEIKKGKWKKREIIPFLFMLAGGIGSVVAPGNFVRAEENIAGGSLHWGSTIKNTSIMMFDCMFDLVKNPLFILIMICFLLVGIHKGKDRLAKYNPIIPFAITLCGLLITLFPFALGYGTYTYIPNRCLFVFNLFAVLSLANDFIFLGSWLGAKYGIVIDKVLLRNLIMAGSVFAYVCLIPSSYYENLPYAQTVAQTHQVKLAYEEWSYLLNYIETIPDKNVEFERGIIDTPIIKSPGITGDADNSINRHIADYYGKDSIRIIWY